MCIKTAVLVFYRSINVCELVCLYDRRVCVCVWAKAKGRRKSCHYNGYCYVLAGVAFGFK